MQQLPLEPEGEQHLARPAAPAHSQHRNARMMARLVKIRETGRRTRRSRVYPRCRPWHAKSPLADLLPRLLARRRRGVLPSSCPQLPPLRPAPSAVGGCCCPAGPGVQSCGGRR
eukprot:scaffold2036_cov115-Isochrysis_galbana.AAC.18